MSLVQAIGLTTLPNILSFALSYKAAKSTRVWYETKLKKPCWHPPGWLFGPIWASLYASMGYSSYLILRDGVGSDKNLAMSLYGSQLALNILFSQIFFRYRKIGLAVINYVILASNVVACIWSFYPINKTAAYLMVPYIAWISFATLLNSRVWVLNKHNKEA